MEIDIREFKKHYNRGWRASRGRTTDGGLDNASGEPMAWHHGYYDEACGRHKWHTHWSGTCPDPNCDDSN